MAEARQRRVVRSRPFVERQVTFYSYDAQQILLGFGRLSGSMYRLGIALRDYLPPERVTALTDSLYEEIVTPLEQEIADDLTRLQEQCQQAQKQGKAIQVDYSNPIQRTLRISYPKALRVLALAQNLDTLVGLLNPLWFGEVITDEQYFALKEKYRNALVDLARRVINLATVQMEKAKEQVAAKEQAKARKAKPAEPAAASDTDLTAEVIPLATAK